jgi:hypothetical protein
VGTRDGEAKEEKIKPAEAQMITIEVRQMDSINSMACWERSECWGHGRDS